MNADLRGLLEKWRADGSPYMADCADELEAALSVAQGHGFVTRVECQMDWAPVDMHHKKWTCRNCGRTHTRNSADGHPYFPCAAAPAQPDGVE